MGKQRREFLFCVSIFFSCFVKMAKFATREEYKAAFKARKNLKKAIAKKAYADAIFNLPENVAERQRLKKEAKEKMAAFHRKKSAHKRAHYAKFKANPALRIPATYRGKNPEYKANNKAHKLRHREAVKKERRKLEELAGIKFL